LSNIQIAKGKNFVWGKYYIQQRVYGGMSVDESSRGRNVLSEVLRASSEIFEKGHRWKILALFGAPSILLLSGYSGYESVFALTNIISVGVFAYLLTTISGEDTEKPDMLELRGEE
jgi:hypothetical protein